MLTQSRSLSTMVDGPYLWWKTNWRQFCRIKKAGRKRQWPHNILVRQGWVWFEQTCVFSGIQFTKHFIEFFFVETRKLVSTDRNMLLTRQTFGQCSGMAAGSKHRAFIFYFSGRICYMFWISKCRGKMDLGLCILRDLQKECGCAAATSDLKTCLIER